MRRYLVVGNKTLGGQPLAEKIAEILEAGPATFDVVVPATPPSDHPWTEAEARGFAQDQLDLILGWLAHQGAEATGSVGDSNPMLAIGDALRTGTYDEVIVSTLPGGVSRWLRMDLPHRVARAFEIPVTHVVGKPAQRRSA